MKSKSYSDAFITCYAIAAFALGMVGSIVGGAWAFGGPIGLIAGAVVGMIPAVIIIALFFPITLPVLALAAWWLERRSAHSPA
jgi:uncharacterized membrane protein